MQTPINPRGAARPVPLSVSAPDTFALVNAVEFPYALTAPSNTALMLFPILATNAQRKLGYFIAWCAANNIFVSVETIRKRRALDLLPSNCLRLPTRNFIILRDAPLMEAYKAHLQGGLDIPVTITHTDDSE